MTQIAHYEVYIDSGKGWQLLERFASEQRHEAYQKAKEQEALQNKVKIIKETFYKIKNKLIYTLNKLVYFLFIIAKIDKP